jgi:LmbE family N-acetylglucosaminyl deacetylase
MTPSGPAGAVLAVVAHPDDETLGPGATLARHARAGRRVVVAIAADVGRAGLDAAGHERIRAAARAAAKELGVAELRFGGFPDQALDTLPIRQLTGWVEDLLDELAPAVVYAHHRGDVNRDHRVVHEAALTAARPYRAPSVEQIFCFETPSSTEWSAPDVENAFLPNCFVDVSRTLEAKLRAMASYSSELRPPPHPRSLESLRHRAAHWGACAGFAAAEPFVLARWLCGDAPEAARG